MLSDGRAYLCGDSISAADITFAALAFPVLLPEETADVFVEYDPRLLPRGYVEIIKRCGARVFERRIMSYGKALYAYVVVLGKSIEWLSADYCTKTSALSPVDDGETKGLVDKSRVERMTPFRSS